MRIATLHVLILTALSTSALEPWSDSRLPVTNRVELFLDATRERNAREAKQLPQLISGGSVDVLHDASGNKRDINQRVKEARPKFQRLGGSGLIRFDGDNDFLPGYAARQSLSSFTVIALVSADENPGEFRGFFSFNQRGRNDFQSGFNADLGGRATTNWSAINIEGGGMSSQRNLLSSPLGFGSFRVLAIVCASNRAVLRVDGKVNGGRNREARSTAVFEEFTVGARQIDMTGSSPGAQSFFPGSVAELILYSAALSEPELQKVEDYLANKHAGLLHPMEDPALPSEKPLIAVKNPPFVQILVPGFTVRELPLKLKNINNLVYAPDGRLFALGYKGNVYQLSDTNGDGLEDKASVFWDNSKGEMPATIGMAWGPGGLYIPVKERIVRLLDTGTGTAVLETFHTGWASPVRFGGTAIDALGIAADKQGNIYFGLGADDWPAPYRIDEKTGKSHYNIKSERGAIVKVSPDGKTREILCSGLRFPGALAFNAEGDLFCTDQEGATWIANGNPFDELLHIQKGRHYGFPPRHPKHLPDVIDEPSVFDYRPQHQSTCGVHFNDPQSNGRIFGPAWWKGDAIVAGESRGKIWRTKLVKTAAGYVAHNQLIACLSMLIIDAVPTPDGDLIVTCHSGAPDWGTGPEGEGRLFKISYRYTNAPHPVLAWNASATEMRISFDRPLDAATLRNLAKQTTISVGRYVSAGDRFETIRPGYQVVQNEMATSRYEMNVLSAGLSTDSRSLILTTSPRTIAVNYAVALPGIGRAAAPSASAKELQQHSAIDLLTDLSGAEVEWRGNDTNWSGWLPHLDLRVARELTAPSAEHAVLWKNVNRPGTLKLRAQLDLWQALRVATQPGSKLDYEYPLETVTVVFKSNRKLDVKTTGKVERESEGEVQVTITSAQNHWLPLELTMTAFGGASSVEPTLGLTWHTAEDSRPRAMQLRRILLPWAKPHESEYLQIPTDRKVPELAGGDWKRGRELFFGERAACFKCHQVRGEGTHVGPDLSNLVHRDYTSVMKDIQQPSAAINPDAVAYNIQLKDGEIVTGVPVRESTTEIALSDSTGKITSIGRDRVESMKASSISLMPEGLLEGLTEQQVKDLLTFLLTAPKPPNQTAAKQ